MAGGQHRADEPRRAEQVRVTQMNRSGRNGRNSCVDGEVCANLMISKRKKPKKLLTPPTSLEMCVNIEAMALWTVIADYRGGTYISQWQAQHVLEALTKWAKASPHVPGSFVGAKTKLKIIAAASDKTENPVAIRRTSNVWYWKPLRINIVVHLIKTVQK